MPTTETWLRFYASNKPEIKYRSAKAILDRPDVPLDMLETLSWEGRKSIVEAKGKGICPENDELA